MKKGFIAFRVSPESVKELKDLSRAQGLPASEVLRKALSLYMSQAVRGGGDGTTK